MQYADLVSDPLRTVETIYAACDREFDEPARDAVTACIAANPKGRFGTHGYRLEDFGLQAERHPRAIRDYVERYDIPVEESAV